jgi:3-oxoacyl-[acyl-carrier-protein] synthase II
VAHATGSEMGDVVESAAIANAFGPHTANLPVTSVKSMTGHMIGAAGALSAIVCSLAIRDGVIPPAINLDRPDPRCQVNVVANKARSQRVDAALANGLAFGGQNASFVFRRIE